MRLRFNWYRRDAVAGESGRKTEMKSDLFVISGICLPLSLGEKELMEGQGVRYQGVTIREAGWKHKDYLIYFVPDSGIGSKTPCKGSVCDGGR
jgi:hypothetical protein